MKFGLFAINMGPCSDPVTAVRVAQAAEATGFESVWTGEHIVLPDPQVSASPVPHGIGHQSRRRLAQHLDPKSPLLDPAVSLAFVAAHTQRVKLGTGIIILPQRNPLVLAKELASVDVVSRGRLIFGLEERDPRLPCTGAGAPSPLRFGAAGHGSGSDRPVRRLIGAPTAPPLPCCAVTDRGSARGLARSVTQDSLPSPRGRSPSQPGRGTPRNTARVFLVVPRPASSALDRGARSGILGHAPRPPLRPAPAAGAGSGGAGEVPFVAHLRHAAEHEATKGHRLLARGVPANYVRHARGAE